MAKLRQALLVCALALSLLPLGFKALAAPLSGELDPVEQKLFFRTYGQETLESRLTRIEKVIFGDRMSGSDALRVQKIVKVALGGTKEQNQAEIAGAVGIATGGEVIVPKTVDEQEIFLERMRVAVSAAKEEEVGKLLFEGVQLWRSKLRQAALEKFEQALAIDPKNAEAHYSMGIIEESSGNLIEALASYNKAVEAKPTNPDYQQAVRDAQEKLQAKQARMAKKTEIKFLAEAATAAFRRGELLTALDLYREIDRRVPDQALVKYNLGTVYLMLGHGPRALEYYGLAKQLKPSEARYAQAYSQLARDLHRQEELRREMDYRVKQRTRMGLMPNRI